MLSFSKETFLEQLKLRFNAHSHRHETIEWNTIEQKLLAQEDKIHSLYMMEQTGGEPDVVGFEEETQSHLFMDCSLETPAGRKSYCYDREALNKRKQNKPENTVIDVAAELGIELLNEQQYVYLQEVAGPFDQKSSSWILTPDDVRQKGGALFGDYRYGRVFIYHNGADSYYSSRGFRGLLKV